MDQQGVEPIEKAKDIIDIVRHALNWINQREKNPIVTHDILEAELHSILEFFGENK